MNSTLDRRHLPSEKYKRNAAWLSALALVVVGLCAYFKFEPLLLITDFHYLVNLVGEMTPPNFAVISTKANIFSSLLQTISMAFLGTLLGGITALLLAVLAAKNTSPNPVLRTAVRLFLSVERVIPGLVVLLVFLIVVGLGPFAGMLSLWIGTIGMFGKLFADSIEAIDPEPVEAVRSVGAGRLQTVRFAVVPQVLPSIIGNLFYAFDINLRAAIGLGIFGGAGVGYEISMAMKLLRYRDALALIMLTIVLVFVFEKLSDALRNRVLGQDLLR